MKNIGKIWELLKLREDIKSALLMYPCCDELEATSKVNLFLSMDSFKVSFVHEASCNACHKRRDDADDSYISVCD